MWGGFGEDVSSTQIASDQSKREFVQRIAAKFRQQ
jgi:hypothetical protein